MKKTIYRVRIEDADGNTVAYRDFDSYEEADAMHDQLLDFKWQSFWAAPLMSTVTVEV